jgi:hypothetical protein
LPNEHPAEGLSLLPAKEKKLYLLFCKESRTSIIGLSEEERYLSRRSAASIFPSFKDVSPVFCIYGTNIFSQLFRIFFVMLCQFCLHPKVCTF